MDLWPGRQLDRILPLSLVSEGLCLPLYWPQGLGTLCPLSETLSLAHLQEHCSRDTGWCVDVAGQMDITRT